MHTPPTHVVDVPPVVAFVVSDVVLDPLLGLLSADGDETNSEAFSTIKCSEMKNTRRNYL